MPVAYKVLGQSAPSATTATTLYTAPSQTQAVVSTITVCNRTSAASTFRIAVRPDGTALANQHYVAFDITVDGNATVPWTIGMTLGDTDVITVYASTGNLSFTAFGSEITA